jgi:hypothetical protein
VPQTASLAWIDRTVMMIYFIFVLAVGFMLKSFMKASTVRCDGGEIAYRIKARNLRPPLTSVISSAGTPKTLG